MPYEPLHHKYRPQTFAQLVGQEAIAITLTNAIASRKIAPAYLFTGPRGTGKTSSARILAKSLNCLSSEQPTANPCGQCEVCSSISRSSALDVMEIDAASNTGVDNIREIIEKAQFAPVQCRYKVYVIDECHMLSTAAFNALLKTLEEPPARVIFVLATTDPQRVLPTIISRCQRFDYRRIPLQAMVAHLQYIATEEKIDITLEAITSVAQIANGGLRDAESLLDQLSLLSGTIVPEKVWSLVGAVPEQDLLELIKAIASNQPEIVLSLCRKIMDRGREPLIVLQNLANFYLNLLIAKTAPNHTELISVSDNTWQQLSQQVQTWETDKILQGQKLLKESEVQIKNTTQPRLWLEITLLSLLPSAASPAHISTPVTSSSPNINLPSTATKKSSTSPFSPQPSDNNNGVIQPRPTPSPTPEKSELTSPKPTPSPIPEKSELTSSQATPSPTPETPEFTPAKPTPSPVPETSELTTPPETVEAIPPTANPDLIQLEQQVISNLKYLTTQAFFKEHCKLISFNGVMATVAVKNQSLFKVAKKKLSELESAFMEVFQHQIRINFKVGNIADFSQDEPEKINHQPIEIEKKIEQQPTEKFVEKISNQQPNQELTLESIDELNGKKLDDREPQTENVIKYYTSAEAKKAAESLAKNFGGEIVISETKKLKPVIINRPDVIMLDEDDMPF